MRKNVRSSKRSWSIGALLLTAACFPLFSLVSRLVNEGFAPLTQVYLRIGLGLIFTMVLFSKHIRWKALRTLSSRDGLALMLMGVVGYSFSTYFTTLGALHASLVNVSIIGNTEPFFVYLYSFLVFKQPIKTQVLLFMFLTMLGVAMVATHSFVLVVSAFGIGEVYVLLFAATSAWYLIGRQLVSDKLNTSEITILGMAIACLSTFVLALFARESFTPQHLLLTGVFMGLLLGGTLNTIVMLLQNFAYKHLEGIVASQILLVATLFSLLYGYVWYHEIVSLPEMVGVVVILASVYMTNKLVPT